MITHETIELTNGLSLTYNQYEVTLEKADSRTGFPVVFHEAPSYFSPVIRDGSILHDLWEHHGEYEDEFKAIGRRAANRFNGMPWVPRVNDFAGLLADIMNGNKAEPMHPAWRILAQCVRSEYLRVYIEALQHYGAEQYVPNAVYGYLHAAQYLTKYSVGIRNLDQTLKDWRWTDNKKLLKLRFRGFDYEEIP